MRFVNSKDWNKDIANNVRFCEDSDFEGTKEKDALQFMYTEYVFICSSNFEDLYLYKNFFNIF